MQFAYSKEGLLLPSDQIIGGPDWLDTDHFDIEAKPQGDPSLISGEQTRLMVQSLLEDRFQLKVHHELRQLPVYNLVVAKNGPKLKLSDDQKPPVPGNNRSQADTPSKGPQGVSEPHRGGTALIRGRTCTILAGKAIPINTVDSAMLTSLPTLLQGVLEQAGLDKTDLKGWPVVDKTGLKGSFDIELQFTPDTLGPAPPDACGPSLFTALEEQLGLKLESARGPVEVIVIDSVSKPSEN
jgi:uncharacterized protein (TIGR03435 family)